MPQALTLKDLQDQIDAHERRLDRAFNLLRQADAAFTGQQATNDQTTAELNEAKGRISALEARVAALEGRVAFVEGIVLPRHQADLERLEAARRGVGVR